MSDSSQQDNPLFSSEVAYQLPYSGEVLTGLPYADDESLVFDIYYPEHRADKLPIVLFVTGYADPGYRAKVGANMKELPQIKSWSRLFAASGLVAITYTNMKPDKDVSTLISYLKSHQDELGVDASKIVLWSCSGNVPNALGVLSNEGGIRGAVLAYGFMLNFDNSEVIAQIAKSYGFAYPSITPSEIPAATPILIIRAGKDEFTALNQSIDNFLQESIHRNSAVSVCNYPDGVHAFDILDNSEASQRVIKSMLGFVLGLLT